MKTPNINLTGVESLNEALEIYLDAMEGKKILGIECGSDWSIGDDGVYYAQCIIGDGSTHATVRIENEAWEGCPERGVDYEQMCYSLGEELGEWLQDKLGSDYEYGVELN